MTLSTEKIRAYLKEALELKSGLLASKESIKDTKERLEIIISTVEECVEEDENLTIEDKSACLDYLKNTYEHYSSAKNNQTSVINSMKKIDETILELKNLLD